MYLSKLSDFPEKEHWVILTMSKHCIPGDERSRTNPGHGYPAHEITQIHYDFFLSEKDWLDKIKEIERNRDNRMSHSNPRDYDYVAFKSSGIATITKSVEVKIEVKV